MPRTAAVVLVFATVACGKDTAKPSTAAWLSADIKTIEDKINGIAFAIDLPAGLTRVPGKDGDLSVEWKPSKGREFDSGPRFTVSFEHFPPASVEDAVASAMPGKEDVVRRKEKVGDGYAVTIHTANKGYVSAYAFEPAGAHGLRCWATYVEETPPVPRFDETTSWLEKSCLTLVAR